MEQTTSTTGKSLTLALWHKFIELVEESSIDQIIAFVGASLLAGFLSAAFVNLSGTFSVLGHMATWNGYAALKTIAVFALVFKANAIRKMLWKETVRIIEFWSGQKVVDTIDGVPVIELLDTLFTEKSFKQGTVCEKFKISTHKHAALAKKLQSLGVLVRGPNNSHVLNESFARQDVANILRGKGSTVDLQPLFRKKSDHHFTSEPSGPEIEERVNALLSSAPGFRVREIRDLACAS